MSDKFQKITVGFVVQNFQKNGKGEFVCVSQEFVAGDQVDYEDEEGNSVDVDTSKEEYQPYHMIQPGDDSYTPFEIDKVMAVSTGHLPSNDHLCGLFGSSILPFLPHLNE